MKRNFGFVLAAWICCGMAFAEELQPKPGFDWTAMENLAVQSRGRTKPFDTYSREIVQFVTGKSGWNKMKPVEVVVSWLTEFDTRWKTERFILVDYRPMKKVAGLDEDRRYFTVNEVRDVEGLRKLVQEGIQKGQRRERLTEVEKKAAQIDNQIGIVEAVVKGEDLTLLPNPSGPQAAWFPISALTDVQGSQLPYDAASTLRLANILKPMLKAYLDGNAAEFNEKSAQLEPLLRSDLAKGNYPTNAALKREVHYNHLRPFRWAWIFYTLAFIVLVSFLVTNNKIFRQVGIAALAAGYGIHIYGFVIRCLISDRPPVTNMYESVIWVAWGCVTFSLIVWAAYKNVVIPTAAMAFAVAALVLADNLPSVLDPHIHPLEPVLRSNFWLTIHVLTITLSYAAFALSLCLGNVVLGNYLFRPKRTERIKELTTYMYRSVQIGVILLAAGTILGGVWADYSWGRFWGWDPKEVWALIALLLYLAVLHGRFTSWLKGFGFVAATVMCFLGVLMAWYGVNFVLGVGLHSYGFGTGGTGYVLGYIAIQLAFMAAAYTRYKKVGG